MANRYTDTILDTIHRGAYDDVARHIQAHGFRIDRDDDERLGEQHVAWLRDRLGLERVDDGGDAVAYSRQITDDQIRQLRTEAAASHKHVAVSESEPQCFRGPVSMDDENPMAHGGIRVEETCGCGHIRSVNLNGGHVEYGTWRDPRD